MAVDYHQRELAVALDPTNPARAMPPVLSRHQRILDVGCGMGQTLVAAHLPSSVEAFGVDSDREAIEAGRGVAPSNVTLVCASGEELPFENEYFDLVFSRVALPYMDINRALQEMSRVLKGGGDLWFALHPASMVLARARRSAWRGDLGDLVFCAYVLSNGLLFNYAGTTFSFLGRRETFQTLSGISKAMKRAGLLCFPLLSSRHFIVEGRKIPRNNYGN